MLSDLSKYRSSVLCDARDGRTPPIGKLPVVDLDDAAQRAAEPEWHDYIARVYHGGKPGVVIHEPSVQRATLSADDDLCLVLASDGVWDNVKRLADLSADLRTQILQAEQYRAVARHAAEAVVGYALRHAVNEGQQDNTTALVVVLGAQAELALRERRGGGDG